MTDKFIDISDDKNVLELYHRLSKNKQELENIITLRNENDNIINLADINIQKVEKLEWMPNSQGTYIFSINGKKHTIEVTNSDENIVTDELQSHIKIKENEIVDSIKDRKIDVNNEVNLIIGDDINYINFNGGYIKINDISISDSFSASVWCRSSTSTWPHSGPLISSREHNGFIVHPDNDSRSWSGYVLPSSGTNDHYKFGESSISDITKWNHYVITYNHDTKEGKIYLNDTKLDSEVIDNIERDESDTIDAYVGTDDPRFDFGDRELLGDVYDIRIYNRVISSNEISKIYDAGL